MSEIGEFFAMGGYAFYVWTSYAFTAVLMLGIVIWSANQYKQEKTNVLRRIRQKEATNTNDT